MIHVILVEPIYEGNVGAVARIMHNFGFSSLRIVGVVPSKNDFYLAMHSEHLLEEAQVFPTLKEALSDIDRAVAFSRRLGKMKPADLAPPELAIYCKKIPHLEIGLVFGRETFGLTDEEAALCPLRCHIPANPDFPSINLAQAVTVALWELTRKADSQTRLPAVPGIELDKMKAYMLDVMESAGFFRSHETTNWESFFAKMLAQLNPNQTMLWRFRQLFNRWHVLTTGKGMGYQHTDPPDEGETQ
ncbi:MAG: RNA methyltransferase [Candidatus Syntrophosphaera sp.]|jgi:tRNA/rRNA methyltransferase|nr:RNA methyltransferase [Candidatus Cloacimonadota bacterium]MDX9949783.1 RNA methyltransferase [Candidatus Syntrophosphaera sp.]